MEQITEILWMRKHNMFFVEMESENCISTELWKDRSDKFNNKFTP